MTAGSLSTATGHSPCARAFNAIVLTWEQRNEKLKTIRVDLLKIKPLSQTSKDKRENKAESAISLVELIFHFISAILQFFFSDINIDRSRVEYRYDERREIPILSEILMFLPTTSISHCILLLYLHIPGPHPTDYEFHL